MGAFEEGFMAGKEGCDPRLCPFDKMTRDWYSWQRGHTLAVKTFWQD